MHTGNAWELRHDEDGRVIRVARDEVLADQPARSAVQGLEDRFFALGPIEHEL